MGSFAFTASVHRRGDGAYDAELWVEQAAFQPCAQLGFISGGGDHCGKPRYIAMIYKL